MCNRAFISADPHGEAILVVKKIHKEFDMFMHDFQHNPDILYDRIMSNIALPDILFAPSEDTKRRMFLRVMRRNNYLRAKGLCMCVLELLDTLEKIKREREERGD
jgi:RNAse (barnase) inhibitor barstar